jgi:hypothetical protein
MSIKGITLEVGKRYRIKMGLFSRNSQWRYGEIQSKNVHSKYSTSYFFHESVMHEKYPRKQYFGSYIWTDGCKSSSHVLVEAQELLLFDTVAYLYSVAAKNPVCARSHEIKYVVSIQNSSPFKE